MARGIDHITCSAKQTVHSIARLRPLLINQLAGKKLRSRILDLEVRVHCEHSECAIGLVAAGMDSSGRIVKVVNARSTGGEKFADEIRQPQSAESIDER